MTAGQTTVSLIDDELNVQAAALHAVQAGAAFVRPMRMNLLRKR